MIWFEIAIMSAIPIFVIFVLVKEHIRSKRHKKMLRNGYKNGLRKAFLGSGLSKEDAEGAVTRIMRLYDGEEKIIED